MDIDYILHMTDKKSIPCLCGCGEMTTPGRSYINHHYIKTHPISKNKKFKDRMSGNNNPAKRHEVSKKISENRKGKCTGESNHMKQEKYRDLFSKMFYGKNNPMFGKKVTQETKEVEPKIQLF